MTDIINDSNRGRYSKNSAQFKEATHNLSRAISSQLTAALVFSAMTILANLAYHKEYKYDQDDDKTMLEEMLTALGTGTASTLSGMVIGGDYLYQAIDQFLFDGTNYGIEILIVEMVNDFVDTINNIKDYAVSLGTADTSSERQKYAKKVIQSSEDGVQTVLQFFGVPYKNLMNTLTSPILYAVDLVNGDEPGTAELPWNTDTKSQSELM